MTEAELKLEWDYRFTERIAILCGTDLPNHDQMVIARKEADEAIQELRGEPALLL